MMIVSGHTSALRALKQRSVSGLAPFKVERVVTIRKTADLSHPPGISDRLKVAISKKFLGTRHRMPGASGPRPAWYPVMAHIQTGELKAYRLAPYPRRR